MFDSKRNLLIFDSIRVPLYFDCYAPPSESEEMRMMTTML